MNDAMIDIIRLVDLNAFAVIVLAVLLVSVILNQEKRGSVHTKLFILLILATMLLALFDTLGWIWEGLPGQAARQANITANTLLYLFLPLPAAIWLMYVHYQLFNSIRHLLTVMRIVALVLAVNAALTLASLQTGWFFSVDAANTYTRGPLFAIHIMFAYSLFFISTAMIMQYRSMQEPEMHRALLLFILPPLMGTFMQALFYGLSLNAASITVSILIVFLRIQNRGLSMDTLTGVFNRRHFERIIKSKMGRASREGFSVLIADLDAFKQINDRFGHSTGDKALQQAVQLFRQALRRDDLIARFGGDEFYILLDIDDEDILRQRVSHIKGLFDQYTRDSQLPYRLSVSMGAAVYDPERHASAEQYLNEVDTLMYTAKNRRQQDAADG